MTGGRQMLQGIEQIFDNITEMITGLKRTTYQEKFETFQAEYGYYFNRAPEITIL